MEKGSEQEKGEKKWWCNFCNFRTDDEQEYLRHSCKDELEKQKKPPEPGGEA